MIEHEIKARVSDVEALEKRLNLLGCHKGVKLHIDDYYLDSPRGYLSNNEKSFRLREQCFVGEDECYFSINFKEPNSDSQIKSREEMEYFINKRKSFGLPSDKDGMFKLFSELGYNAFAVISKVRFCYTLNEINIYLDIVAKLGNFIEIEIMADENDTFDYADVLTNLAATLGITEFVRKSYLELMIEHEQHD